MKLVFLSRSFPPTIGGMENQNFELLRSLESKADVVSIVNPKGKKYLPVFLPKAAVQLLLKSRDADAILLGDAAISPLGVLAGAMSGKPVFCIAHGLDVSFDNAFYQRVVVRYSLPRMNHIFAVGNATRDLAVQKGIAENNISFVPNGVRPPQSDPASEPPRLRFLKNKSFVLTLGRLVERKGVSWFLKNVYPEISSVVDCVVAGDGPDRDEIAELASNFDNVYFLGVVDEQEKAWLLSNAEIFVQPNIPVVGDMEGFGIAALEASASGSVVVASRLEGLKDAIADGKNGVLVAPKDAAAFRDTIVSILNADDVTARSGAYQAYTLENCHWDRIADKYLEEIGKRVARKLHQTGRD